MTQQAYSATALQKVANLTNIQSDDGKIVAASKFVGGLPLKVTITAFAAFEFAVRTAVLIAASPLYFLANKTFTEMTETTKSSAQTIVNATVSLATIRAPKKEEPAPPPAPKTIRDHLNDAVAYARDKGNAALATVQKNPGTTAAVVVGSIAIIALYYSYPTILAYFQGASSQPNLKSLDGDVCLPNELPNEKFIESVGGDVSKFRTELARTGIASQAAGAAWPNAQNIPVSTPIPVNTQDVPVSTPIPVNTQDVPVSTPIPVDTQDVPVSTPIPVDTQDVPVSTPTPVDAKNVTVPTPTPVDAKNVTVPTPAPTKTISDVVNNTQTPGVNRSLPDSTVVISEGTNGTALSFNMSNYIPSFSMPSMPNISNKLPNVTAWKESINATWTDFTANPGSSAWEGIKSALLGLFVRLPRTQGKFVLDKVNDLTGWNAPRLAGVTNIAAGLVTYVPEYYGLKYGVPAVMKLAKLILCFGRKRNQQVAPQIIPPQQVVALGNVTGVFTQVEENFVRDQRLNLPKPWPSYQQIVDNFNQRVGRTQDIDRQTVKNILTYHGVGGPAN